MVLPSAAAAPPRHTLRGYQRRIVDEVGRHGSSIIVLPTGAGKTHTAAELVLRKLRDDPGRSVVFFVPTTHLVEQQAKVLRDWLPQSETVHEFCGGKAPPPAGFRVLVSTPAAFLAALESRSIPGADAPAMPGAATAAGPNAGRWARYGLIVFDEVHHHLKDHPYRHIASQLRSPDTRQLLPAHLEILGLTATLSYAVGDDKMKKSIDKLRFELGIKHIATASEAELEEGGYHGKTTKSMVDLPPIETPGVVPPSDRKPHKMLPMFIERCNTRTATPAALLLMQFSEALESHTRALIGDAFSPPNRHHKHPGPSAGAAVHRNAHDYKGVSSWGSDAGKLLERFGRRPEWRAALEWLMHSYEAVRIAVVSWEEQAAEGAAMYLRMVGMEPGMPGVDAAVAAGIPADALALLHRYFEVANKTGTPRFDHLKVHLLELKRQRGSAFHGILFAEQRVVAHVLSWFIDKHDPDLSKLFATAVIHAEAPATHLLRMTKAKGQQAIEKFRRKEANLLVATNAAEEGMDIPQANVVLRFDAMHTAVSLVQGRGRAREAGSDFVVLSQRSDRPVATLQDAERNQSAFIQQHFGNGGSVGTSQKSDDDLAAAARQSQTSRELVARKVLLENPQGLTPSALLHAFCQKAKLSADFVPSAAATAFTVRVQSITFGLVEGTGQATTLKGAKDAAAQDLVARLREKLRSG